jgi:hypothetical protein
VVHILTTRLERVKIVLRNNSNIACYNFSSQFMGNIFRLNTDTVINVSRIGFWKYILYDLLQKSRGYCPVFKALNTTETFSGGDTA